MNLILLVQQHMLPVPVVGVVVVQEFGSESILDGEGNPHRGVSMLLQAEPEVFVEWLKPFDGFWVSNNPMLGNWHVVHVRKALTDIGVSFVVVDDVASVQVIMRPELQSQYTDDIKKELWRRIQSDMAATGLKVDHETNERVTLIAKRYFIELILANRIVIQ